jgi:hypothetical protein
MFGSCFVRSCASVFVVSFMVGACTSQTSPEAGVAEAASQAASAPPCEGAELHSRTPHTTCVDGHVRNMELDDWCCPDQTNHEVDAVVSDTAEACPDGTVAAAPAPACGKAGSDCDQTACGKKGGTCTTRAGGCICEIRFGGCGLTKASCYDSGCSAKGGACTRYDDLAECVCVAS